jgi:hypothetical protein
VFCSQPLSYAGCRLHAVDVSVAANTSAARGAAVNRFLGCQMFNPAPSYHTVLATEYRPPLSNGVVELAGVAAAPPLPASGCAPSGELMGSSQNWKSGPATSWHGQIEAGPDRRVPRHVIPINRMPAQESVNNLHHFRLQFLKIEMPHRKATSNHSPIFIPRCQSFQDGPSYFRSKPAWLFNNATSKSHGTPAGGPALKV